MDGFQLQQISTSDADFLSALKSVGLEENGLERAEAYVLIDRESGERIAYGGLEIYAPHAMLRSLAVPEAHRGQGYASLLCTHALAQAAARGVTHVYALTETVPGFFTALGFEAVDRGALPAAVLGSPLVQQVCGKDADIFRLSLS